MQYFDTTFTEAQKQKEAQLASIIQPKTVNMTQMDGIFQFMGDLYLTDSKQKLQFVFDSGFSKSWIKPGVLSNQADASNQPMTFNYGQGQVTGSA